MDFEIEQSTMRTRPPRKDATQASRVFETEHFSAMMVESLPWLEMPCIVTEPKILESCNMTQPPASATMQVPELSEMEDFSMTHFEP